MNKTERALAGMARKKICMDHWGYPSMRKAKDGQWVSAARAAQRINAQQDEIDRLRLALNVSLAAHAPNLPGDSRAVPDWFVACAAVSCELDDKDGRIKASLVAAQADMAK